MVTCVVTASLDHQGRDGIDNLMTPWQIVEIAVDGIAILAVMADVFATIPVRGDC